MTDEWLERRLRRVDERVAPNPTFAEDLFTELTAELGLEGAVGRRGPVGGRRSPGRANARRRSRRWPGLLLVAALALGGAATAAVGAGAFLQRAQPEPTDATDPDLMTRVVGAGRIRIAVQPDAPQVPIAAGGSASGFDVDVAYEIGRRLGVGVDVVVIRVEQMLSGGANPAWDLAMPATGLLGALTAATRSGPYYYWPVLVVVGPGSPAATIAEVNGQSICAVAGSSGAAWLAGHFNGTSATPILAPPGSPSVIAEPDDAACLADVKSGRASAAITARVSAGDIAVHAGLRTLGGPVLTEERTVIAPSSGPDPAGLIARVDDAIAAMRADGALANFSRQRFGGADLTTSNQP